MSRSSMQNTTGVALGSAGAFKWTQDAPENRDAISRVEDGPPEYGFFESAAEFGLSITGELEHCCKFGQKSEFQEWMAQLSSRARKDSNEGEASDLRSSGTVEHAGADQMCLMRQQLLCAQAAAPAGAGIEQACSRIKLQFGTPITQPQPAVTAIHARSFDTWMASHQPPADMRRVLAPPLQLCEARATEKRSSRNMAADAAISRTVHKLARRAPPPSQAVAMVQQLAAQHAASSSTPASADATSATLTSGMTQALRDWVDGIPDASQCCSISRPAACWTCSGEDPAQRDAAAGLRAAWTWLMAFVGRLDDHGAVDTVAVVSVTITHAMEAHAAEPAVAGLVLPLLRLQHTCSGNVSSSSTILPLLRVLCALQRLLAAALPAVAAAAAPASATKDEPTTAVDPGQLQALLTTEPPRATHAASGVCVRCLRVATAEVLAMAVAAVARAPEAAASNAVSQQLLQILSSEALVAAAGATLGDAGLPQRARSAISASLAVFREAAAATTVRKSVDVHMMYALQLHAPDVPAALNALHRSLADAGALRRRGRTTLVRWVCDWACCPVLSLRPRDTPRASPQRKAKRSRRMGSRSATPATPAVPPTPDTAGAASRRGAWAQEAAAVVLPDVLSASRGWFAVRLLQAIAAEEQQEQPEADAWLVLMGTPSSHLGKGASLKAAEGAAAAATSRPGTPSVVPPGTPATPAGGGSVADPAATPAAADFPGTAPEAAPAVDTHPLQAALLDWMANSSILGATALTGEHGRTAATFAVMLAEVGLLCTDGLARQCFAEAGAQQPRDSPSAAQTNPSTPASRLAWFSAALDPRLVEAIPPSTMQGGGSAGPSPPFSPAAAGPDSPAPPSSVSSPASGPSQSRTASAEPLSVPPPAPPAPAPAAPPAVPPLPFAEWLGSCDRRQHIDVMAADTAAALSAAAAAGKRARPPEHAEPGPPAQVRKVSFDASAAAERHAAGPSGHDVKVAEAATGLDAQAARASLKVQKCLWVATGTFEAPKGADSCLAACRRLPPAHQRLVTAWLMRNLACFAPPHLKPVAACMQSLSITAWLASVKRNWWRVPTDALPGKGSPGRFAYSARTRLPHCPDADYLSTAPQHAEWLPAVVSTLVALRADAHAAMLAACVALRSMEHLASVPAAALLRLCCTLHALLPTVGTLGLALPLADALRWAAARSAATAVRCSTLQRAAALLSVALAPPAPAQDPTIPTKPPVEKRLPANSPWARPASAASAPTTLHVRPPAEYQAPDAEAVATVVQALQLAASADELLQAAGGDVEVAVAAAASGCGLEGTSAVFGVADVAVSAYVKVAEEGAIAGCTRLLTPLLAAVASAADAALAAEDAPGPRPALQVQLTSAVVSACIGALGAAGSCAAGGAVAEFVSAASVQGICDIAAATRHCLDAPHAESATRLHAAFLAAMHSPARTTNVCVHCMVARAGTAAHSCSSSRTPEQTLLPLLQRILPVDTLHVMTGKVRGLLHTAVRDEGDASAVACAASNVLLSAPALRLALFDAVSHPPPTPAGGPAMPAAAAFACMASLHFGGVVTVADAGAADWQVPLVRALALATPNRHAHVRPLLSAALECPTAATEADAGGAVQQQQLVQMIVAALLRYEGCAPVAIALALEAAAVPQKGSRSLHAAVLRALQRAIEAPPGADLSRQARMLAGGASLSGELAADLPAPLVGGGAGRAPPHIRMSALIDTCLVLLSRTDVYEWRAHARRLVQQIANMADALHCACAGVEPPPPASDLIRELCRELLHSTRSRCLLQALWLRLELLMPVMPIVYHDATQPAAVNLRHCLACALVKLVAHGAALAAGSPTATTAQGSTNAVSLARVERRMVVLLQALFSEQWSRWIVCHESRGSPKVTGRMLDQDVVVAMVRGVYMPSDVRWRLQSALPTKIPDPKALVPVRSMVALANVAEGGRWKAAALCTSRFKGMVQVS